MMKCKRLSCMEAPVGYARIYHVYDQGFGDVLCADWAYCAEHLKAHFNRIVEGGSQLNVFFHTTMNGYRED